MAPGWLRAGGLSRSRRSGFFRRGFRGQFHRRLADSASLPLPERNAGLRTGVCSPPNSWRWRVARPDSPRAAQRSTGAVLPRQHANQVGRDGFRRTRAQPRARRRDTLKWIRPAEQSGCSSPAERNSPPRAVRAVRARGHGHDPGHDPRAVHGHPVAIAVTAAAIATLRLLARLRSPQREPVPEPLHRRGCISKSTRRAAALAYRLSQPVQAGLRLPHEPALRRLPPRTSGSTSSGIRTSGPDREPPVHAAQSRAVRASSAHAEPAASESRSAGASPESSADADSPVHSSESAARGLRLHRTVAGDALAPSPSATAAAASAPARRASYPWPLALVTLGFAGSLFRSSSESSSSAGCGSARISPLA